MCPQLLYRQVLVLNSGLRTLGRTMGRPGTALVPAGRPCSVPRFAIVNILSDGSQIALTILRGYFYRKHQSQCDDVTMQTSTVLTKVCLVCVCVCGMGMVHNV